MKHLNIFLLVVLWATMSVFLLTECAHHRRRNHRRNSQKGRGEFEKNSFLGNPRHNEVLTGPSSTLVEALRQVLRLPKDDFSRSHHPFGPPPRPPKYMMDLYRKISQGDSSLPRHANTVRSFKPKKDDSSDMLLYNVSALAKEQVLGAWVHLRGSSSRSRSSPRLRTSRILVYLFPDGVVSTRGYARPSPIMMHTLSPHQQEVELTRAVREVTEDISVDHMNSGVLGIRVEELRRGRYVSRSSMKLVRRPPLLFVYSSDPALLDLQALGAAALNITQVASPPTYSRSDHLKRYTRGAAGDESQIEEDLTRQKRSIENNWLDYDEDEEEEEDEDELDNYDDDDFVEFDIIDNSLEAFEDDDDEEEQEEKEEERNEVLNAIKYDDDDDDKEEVDAKEHKNYILKTRKDDDENQSKEEDDDVDDEESFEENRNYISKTIKEEDDKNSDEGKGIGDVEKNRIVPARSHHRNHHNPHHPILTNELPVGDIFDQGALLPKVFPTEAGHRNSPARRHRRRRRKQHRKKGKEDDNLIPLPENYSKVKWGESEKRRKNKRRRRNRKLPDDWMAAALNTLSNDANAINFGGSGGVPRAQSTRPCGRHSLWVDFRTLGWDHYIMAPPGFNAFYCGGVCPNPLNKKMSGSNHAIIQSMIYSMGLSPDVPAPCCVPDKMDSVSVLYMDEEERFVLKSYPKMVVSSCSCQ